MTSSGRGTIRVINEAGPLGFVFLVAYIGAVTYFAQQNSGFWGFWLALLQGAVWPAYVVFHVLQILHA